jgi:hypothetical protein
MILLRIVTIIGGIYEILIGIILVFWAEPFLNLLGASIIIINFPMFHQMAGLLLITFGILMIISFFELERFYIVPLMSVFLRLGMQFVIFLNLSNMPEIMNVMIIFAVIDIVFAIITILLFLKVGFPIRGGNK